MDQSMVELNQKIDDLTTQVAYLTGKRIVDLVREDLRPADIMTRQAFENAIVVNSAIGGSTNAPIHLNAVARHLGVPLSNQDWEELGWDVPLLLVIVCLSLSAEWFIRRRSGLM